jgi:hypothetical protein
MNRLLCNGSIVLPQALSVQDASTTALSDAGTGIARQQDRSLIDPSSCRR